MSFPRVAILCPELGTNALGRALLLARLLPPEARARILGLLSLPELWPPARGAQVPIEAFRIGRARELPQARRWLRARLDCELLLVSKALPTSLGLACAAVGPRARLALDVDDWELGLAVPHDGSETPGLRGAGAALVGAVRRGQPNSLLGTWLCQPLVRRVPARLVSNRWLQQRFGGTLLPHVRDAAALDPQRVDAASLRAGLELDARTWVGFVGTVRPHKGLPDLVAALARRSGPRAPGLLLLGADPADPVVADVARLARARLGAARVRVRHRFPLDQLAAHVQLADVIAIPTRDQPAGRGQLPAKLFDAMAMAKPVVATALNDVPEILAGCGRVVAPGDVAGLAAALAAFEDPSQRRLAGAAARKRLLERYSFGAGRRTLESFVLRATA